MHMKLNIHTVIVLFFSFFIFNCKDNREEFAPSEIVFFESYIKREDRFSRETTYDTLHIIKTEETTGAIIYEELGNGITIIDSTDNQIIVAIDKKADFRSGIKAHLFSHGDIRSSTEIYLGGDPYDFNDKILFSEGSMFYSMDHDGGNQQFITDNLADGEISLSGGRHFFSKGDYAYNVTGSLVEGGYLLMFLESAKNMLVDYRSQLVLEEVEASRH